MADTSMGINRVLLNTQARPSNHSNAYPFHGLFKLIVYSEINHDKTTLKDKIGIRFESLVGLDMKRDLLFRSDKYIELYK